MSKVTCEQGDRCHGRAEEKDLGKSFLKQADSRLCLPLWSPCPRPQQANMKAKLFPSCTPQPFSLASSSSTRFSPRIFLVSSTEAACTCSPAITNPLVDM